MKLTKEQYEFAKAKLEALHKLKSNPLVDFFWVKREITLFEVIIEEYEAQK